MRSSRVPGRAYVYRLSAYGESGVTKALLGVKTVGELNPSFLEKLPVQPERLAKKVVTERPGEHEAVVSPVRKSGLGTPGATLLISLVQKIGHAISNSRKGICAKIVEANRVGDCL
jgi:hypothetical protein